MTTLLADGDVAPLLERNARGTSPILLTCDHYGRLLPRKLGDLGLPPSELERHIAWDIGIAGVAERLADALDAHLIAQRYSRLVIDCNRPHQSAGSIPLISEATAIPGNAGLSQTEIAQRRTEIFAPYHDCIRRALDARRLDEMEQHGDRAHLAHRDERDQQQDVAREERARRPLHDSISASSM